MRFAYADPPYPGMSHLYRDHPDYAGEVDHAALIARLVDEFPDGWGLSTNEPTLREVIALCPPKVRILAWCKKMARPFPNVHVQYCWEPLILYGGRRGLSWDWRCDSYLVEQHSFVQADIRGQNFMGKKPERFCFWLFRCLGALPGDELCDLFPGSGAVTRAWDKYQRQVVLPLEGEREKQARMIV